MSDINHAEREHALLSASGAKRWMACTPSARLEEHFPELASRYAEEGTKAHETAEKILRARIEGKRRPAFKKQEIKEIAQNVQPYVDYVWNLYIDLLAANEDAVLFLESRVDFSDYVPAGYGTGDAIVISNDTLHIIDLKYGQGVPVSATGNEQLRLYAIGSVKLYSDIYDISKVVTHICQPRIDDNQHSQEELSVDELMSWASEEVAPRAKLAFAGQGEYVDGEHCRFCKAAAICRHRLEKYTAITRLQDKLPAELASTGEISVVLKEMPHIKAWLGQVERYAIAEMTKGIKFDGVKLVAGISRTVLKDEDKLLELLKGTGVDELLLYKPKELLSRTDLRKVIGPSKFDELTKDLYEKQAGSPKIDRADSKKEEWKPGGDFDTEELKQYA